MIPRFSLARPRTLDEAFAAFAAADGEGAYIAGGTELLQVMKMGFAQFETLIDIKAIAQLQGIEVTDGSLRIGATTTHRSIERSAEVLARFPAWSISNGGSPTSASDRPVRSAGTSRSPNRTRTPPPCSSPAMPGSSCADQPATGRCSCPSS